MIFIVETDGGTLGIYTVVSNIFFDFCQKLLVLNDLLFCREFRYQGVANKAYSAKSGIL